MAQPATTNSELPGYSYGDPSLERSPVSAQELDELKASVLFGPADEAALADAGRVLADQIDDVLDVWYGFVGANPHLLTYFSTPEGEPIPEYLTRVRTRFGRWILDTCTRPYDQVWLDYQHEIALRHTADKKNHTDAVDSLPLIPLRYLIAFIYPISATMRPFLAKKGHDPQRVDEMFQAWFKSVTMQIALWARPYAEPGNW
jgi:Protoglobin